MKKECIEIKLVSISDANIHLECTDHISMIGQWQGNIELQNAIIYQVWNLNWSHKFKCYHLYYFNVFGDIVKSNDLSGCLSTSPFLTHLLIHCFNYVWNEHSQIARFMGPTWGPSRADRTQVGPMLAPWTLISGLPKPVIMYDQGWFIWEGYLLGYLRL